MKTNNSIMLKSIFLKKLKSMEIGEKFNFLYSTALRKIEVVKIDEEHYEFNGDELNGLFKRRMFSSS